MFKKHRHWTRVCSFISLVSLLGLFWGSSQPGYTQMAVVPAATTEMTTDTSPVFVYLAREAFDPLQTPAEVSKSVNVMKPKVVTESNGIYIVQFTGPVQSAWKQAVLDAGGKLGDYVPDYAFLTYLDARAKSAVASLPFVRWVGPYQPVYKLAADIDIASIGEEGTTATRSYRVVLAPWADSAATGRVLRTFSVHTRAYGSDFVAVLDQEQVVQIAQLEDVIWIEPYYLRQTLNDVGGADIMNGATAWEHGLSGAGVTVAVADTGLDTGNPETIHPDFSGRVAHISSWPVVYVNYGGGCEIANVGADDGAADVNSGHGTHVTGSVAGNGARSEGQLKGLGYEATVTFQALEQYTTWTNTPSTCSKPQGYYLTGIPDDVGEVLGEAYDWGVRIHNVSWGGGELGQYDITAAQFDTFLYEHPDMLSVVSAGNSGTDTDQDGFVDESSILPPGTAKNVLSIGASDSERSSGGYRYTWGQAWPSDFQVNPTRDDLLSDNREELAGFSSRGPTADGRIKPDVVAPGTNIVSVRSSMASGTGWGIYDADYIFMGGTSMAAPLVTGAATVVREYYIRDEGWADPSAALIKATLINSAVDIAGYGYSGQEAALPIPNQHEGWGRVNLAAAVASSTSGQRLFVDEVDGLETGVTRVYTYNVQSSEQPFKITLAWTDYPGSVAAGRVLVNNLNLRVTASDGTVYWGNRFNNGWSQAGGSMDLLNNVENVYIEIPETGEWQVEVMGYNVPQGPQPFALIVDGEIVLPGTLRITAIQPARAMNNATITATLYGENFTETTGALLRRGSEILTGTHTLVDVSGAVMTTTFDLSGATPGVWDVMVASSPAVTAVLSASFTVLDAMLPDLTISKTTDALIVIPGSSLTYTLVMANQANVIASGVIFTETLPPGTLVASVYPTCANSIVVISDTFTCSVPQGTLAINMPITYTLVVSVPVSMTGVLLNRVEVGSDKPDAYPDDNAAYTLTRVGFGVYLPLILKPLPPVPAAPMLYPIDNADQDDNYIVSWSPGTGSAPDAYDLEENGTIFLAEYTATTYEISDKEGGTYIYRVRGKNISGLGAWSTPQTVTVPFPDPIRNGNFESGVDGSWAEESSTGYDLIVNYYPEGLLPHSGQWLAWLGGNFNEVSTIGQQVTIPETRKTLSFWYVSGTRDACGKDFAYVIVGDTVLHTFNLCFSESTKTWQSFSVDVSAYAGQTVDIQFHVETDDTENSNFFIDDVTLE
ncbi:MAG: S8 family serine peptidase [Anaerolineae bacterium]|nr:S8 family serine peptidase [Anaerolineae bacterium]